MFYHILCNVGILLAIMTLHNIRFNNHVGAWRPPAQFMFTLDFFFFFVCVLWVNQGLGPHLGQCWPRWGQCLIKNIMLRDNCRPMGQSYTCWVPVLKKTRTVCRTRSRKVGFILFLLKSKCLFIWELLNQNNLLKTTFISQLWHNKNMPWHISITSLVREKQTLARYRREPCNFI